MSWYPAGPPCPCLCPSPVVLPQPSIRIELRVMVSQSLDGTLCNMNLSWEKKEMMKVVGTRGS